MFHGSGSRGAQCLDPGEAPETSAVSLAQVFLLGDAWKDSFSLFFTFSVGI